MNESQTTRFEVRCPSCDVSFPVGTRRCVHCGGRMSKSLGKGSGGLRSQEPARTQEVRGSRSPIDYDGGESPFDEAEDEVVEQRGSILRRSLTLVWVVILIGISVIRACMEGG
jgi:hypothetical protein